MNTINLDFPVPRKKSKVPLFNLGFRPFFLCAALFAALSMSVWFLAYTLHFGLPLMSINLFQWHAHEMIYGYSVAVIAGFLLTATKSWTGIQTLHGVALFSLVLLWLAARLFIINNAFVFAAVFDLLFMSTLIAAITYPIIRAKKWKQLAIISKLVALCGGNVLFYLGCLGVIKNGIYLGIYGGLYLIIGLIMMMGRRVIPSFIESGIGYTVKLRNSKLIDVLSLTFFLVFFVAELTQNNPVIAAYSALLLSVFNTLRLAGWYTHGLWKKPLLWSLYCAMGFICLGFVLHYLAYAIGLSKFIAIHAFAYGGIGMMTLGMMARVAWGHTARNIHHPPSSIQIAFLLLSVGAVFRVLFCALLPTYYTLWVGLAQALWIAAFLFFIYRYYLVLTKERLDGQFG